MFNIFGKIEYTKITDKVERICVTPCNDTALTYLIKLQNNPEVFKIIVWRGEKITNTVAFTRENDSVSFEYCNEKKIKPESFKNNTFNV